MNYQEISLKYSKVEAKYNRNSERSLHMFYGAREGEVEVRLVCL